MTCCSDENVRIWSDDGKLIHVLPHIGNQLMASKWNKNGTAIATGGSDKTVRIWALKDYSLTRSYELEAEISDIDWQGNEELAVSTLDANIYYFHAGNDKAQRIWRGHKQDINMIAWNWESVLLASCSEDRTAMVWSPKSD